MIGTDIVWIPRISYLIERFGPRFLDRILTPAEQNRISPEYVAGRWAAKEAISKAMGTGLGAGFFPWKQTEIEILNDHTGKPIVFLSGEPAKISISISHDKEYAIATSILVATSNTDSCL
jgi:holo-[acyl-carrier protein] synthase